MPTFPKIERYYASLAELIEAGGSDNELSVHPAFQNCLAAYCGAHKDKLVLVPELATTKDTKPDGTIRDSLRMTRGYWEPKDTHDNLDAESQEKFKRGYPRDNILFEDSPRAESRRPRIGGRLTSPYPSLFGSSVPKDDSTVPHMVAYLLPFPPLSPATQCLTCLSWVGTTSISMQCEQHFWGNPKT